MMRNKPSLQSAVVKSVWSINYFLCEFKRDVPKKKYYGRHREQEMERGGLLQTNVFTELKLYVCLNWETEGKSKHFEFSLCIK